MQTINEHKINDLLDFDLPNGELMPILDDDEFLDEPSGWRMVRVMHPEKWSNYTITNKMHSYLKGLGNEMLYHQVMVEPRRLMLPNPLSVYYIYPTLPGCKNPALKTKPKNKAISHALKRMLNEKVTNKNPFTGLKETLTMDEHAALAIMAGGIKKGNFRHLSMLLERTEGKVAEEINGNLTMGLASALKLISREDDDGEIIDQDDDGDDLDND